MNIKAYAGTDVGNRRENNEDHFLIDERLGLYLVCDGMGGHAAGEIAAETTANLVRDYIFSRRAVVENAASLPGGHYRVLELAEAAAQHASQELYRMACSNAKYAGMGTTLTLLVIVQNKAVMAHVGDSRLYLVRDNQLHQLSADHTLAQELFTAGAIEEHELHTSRAAHVLTRAVGSQAGVQVETLLFDLSPNDKLLLCSDGLSNYFKDKDETLRLLSANKMRETPDQLIQFAKERGGRDNITLILLHASAPGKYTPSEREIALKVMRNVGLFRNLSLNRLVRILNASAIKQVEPGQTVCTPGTKVAGMYLILSGTLTIEKGGKTIDTITEGRWFGETALLHPYKSKETVAAKQRCQVLLLERRGFERLARRIPRLGYLLAKRISEKLVAAHVG